MACYYLEVQVRNRVRGSPPGPAESSARMNGGEVRVCPEVYIQAMFLVSPPKTHTHPPAPLYFCWCCALCLGAPLLHPQLLFSPKGEAVIHLSTVRLSLGRMGPCLVLLNPQYFANNSVRGLVSIPVTH